MTNSAKNVSPKGQAMNPLVQVHRLIVWAISLLSKLPDTFISTLGRFSIAAVFWQSGQTKVEGFAIDIVHGTFTLGMPRLSDSAIALFRDEYRLPMVPPEIAAHMAAFSEHFFSALILIGFATRFSSIALLVMTLTIEIFVYPDAYPTHGVWATVLLFLMVKGPGRISIDYWISKHFKH